MTWMSEALAHGILGMASDGSLSVEHVKSAVSVMMNSPAIAGNTPAESARMVLDIAPQIHVSAGKMLQAVLGACGRMADSEASEHDWDGWLSCPARDLIEEQLRNAGLEFDALRIRLAVLAAHGQTPDASPEDWLPLVLGLPKAQILEERQHLLEEVEGSRHARSWHEADLCGKTPATAKEGAVDE